MIRDCDCTISHRVNGDGCRYCQPQEHIDTLIKWLKEKDKEPGGYISYCWLESRKSDAPLVEVDSNGKGTKVRIAGYAIVPLENYAKFFEGDKKQEILALAEKAKQFLEDLKEVKGEL